jgi:hypothetical protein
MTQRAPVSDFLSGILAALRGAFDRVVGRTEAPKNELAESNVTYSPLRHQAPASIGRGSATYAVPQVRVDRNHRVP